MNFSQMIFEHYRNDEITFDADGTLNLSVLAMIDIQRFIFPTHIRDFDLLDTAAGMAILQMHKSIPKKVVPLREVRLASQLKGALFEHINQMQSGMFH